MNHKLEIAAVLADWTSKFDHIWSTQKENRIRVLTERYEWFQALIDALVEDARLATETLRNVDPEAAEVLVNGREVRAYHDRQEKILRDIAEETGQLLARPHPSDQGSVGLPEFGTIAQDENGNWFGVK